MATKRTFDKEMFKRSVLYNVKTLFRKDISEATKQQIFQAVSYAVKDSIMDAWIATQKAYDEQDPKTVYYMSMEFLMGRALGNNLINLTFYDEVKEVLEELVSRDEPNNQKHAEFRKNLYSKIGYLSKKQQKYSCNFTENSVLLR